MDVLQRIPIIYSTNLCHFIISISYLRWKNTHTHIVRDILNIWRISIICIWKFEIFLNKICVFADCDVAPNWSDIHTAAIRLFFHFVHAQPWPIILKNDDKTHNSRHSWSNLSMHWQMIIEYAMMYCNKCNKKKLEIQLFTSIRMNQDNNSKQQILSCHLTQIHAQALECDLQFNIYRLEW